MAIKKRGLIMVASITGNTYKIAEAFKHAFDKLNWCCDIVRIDNTTNFKKNPVYFDDYDIVALGSPVMAGLPAPDIGRVLGLTQPEPPRMWSFDRGPGGNNADATHTSAEAPSTEDTKAVVFCTYAGGIREAYSTLAVEKQYLECPRLKIVGQFSCPGGEISHMAVDRVSAIMGVQVEKAAPLVQKYKANPNDIYFKKLTPEQHQQMAEAVADKRDMPDYPGMEAFIAPKYDLSNRPNQNDFTMAEIFMQNLIQDFFFDRETPQESHGEYLCIG